MTVRKVQSEQMDLAEVGAALAVSGSLQDSSEKSQPNGYASLDGSGKVPTSELPASVLGTLSYQGSFTPPAPALPAAVTGNKGWYYVASTAGTDPTSGLAFEIGDWAVSNGTVWEKIDNSDNQVITLTGDVTGSGAGSFATTLSNTGVTAGTYKSVTVDAKGRVSAGTNPTTLAGYGITDAQPLDQDLTDIAALSPTNNDFLQRKSGAWTNRTPTQVTADLIAFGGTPGPNVQGLVPASTAQNITDQAVLRADGTWAYPGKIIQVLTATIPFASTNTTIPYDDTPPLNTEGATLFGGQAITPKLSTSRIGFTVPLWLDANTNNRNIVFAGFTNSTNTMTGATLIPNGVTVVNVDNSGRPQSVTFRCEYTPGSTATFYFFLRYGTSGGIVYVNQSNAGTGVDFGGNGVSLIRIEEVV